MDQSVENKMASSQALHVALLCGGRSVEHEVSIRSARFIYENLKTLSQQVLLIGIDRQGCWHLADETLFEMKEVPSDPEPFPILHVIPGAGKYCLSLPSQSNWRPELDVFFPITHGTFGEDGCLQGLLKSCAVPFVGSSVLGSAVGMDKDLMKRLLIQAGLPVGAYTCLKAGQKNMPSYQDLCQQFNLTAGAPLFVKPANAGSSVGVSKVNQQEGLTKALSEAFKFDSKVLIEQGIVGREIEVSVCGNSQEAESSLPAEVLPQHSFYSYEAKYLDAQGAQFAIPARLDESTQNKIKRMAEKAFICLEAHGLARVDFFLTQQNQILINEINTLPGFTAISLYPKMWEATGLSSSKLIQKLLNLAVTRFEQELKLQIGL